MPIEYVPPKYVQIVNALQTRISDGTYAPGTMLPSETVLMGEFDVSRPVVVRALEILRQDGWINSQQGKGRFARGKPPALRTMPAHAAALLADDVEGQVRMLDVAEVPAPPRIAAELGLPEGAPVVARRHLMSLDGVGPTELRTTYVPTDVAAGTNLTTPNPLPRGLKEYLHARKGMQFGHARERISTRPATPEERQLLALDDSGWVLTMLLRVTTVDDVPAFVIHLAVPPGRLEFEDSFPLT
ncbi:GntR family transcriptional regulator [Dactylosporangium sp. NPDC051541]|uniref:GntR family transcriptional regulator n=1 Tax=Dactylosporangium sp. NPDC051541 TaxID=3363977 RepID=UPI00379C32F0